MTVHSYYPAFVQLNYHSPAGAHTQRFSTKEWNSVPLVPGNGLGSYNNWLGLPVDGEEMVLELVDKLQAFNIPGTVYDNAVVYTLASVDAPAIPRATLNLGIPGTSASVLWWKAVMQTWVMRDTEYNMAKIVQLDCPQRDSWEPLSDLSSSVPAQELVGVFTSDAWAWSSKANLKIATFQKITYKLSDTLRKEYNMD